MLLRRWWRRGGSCLTGCPWGALQSCRCFPAKLGGRHLAAVQQCFSLMVECVSHDGALLATLAGPLILPALGEDVAFSMPVAPVLSALLAVCQLGTVGC